MSRLGKNAVDIPKGVKATVDNKVVHMEGPKGKLDLNIPAGIKVEHKEEKFFVSRTSDEKQSRSNHGTIRAILKNMVKGVTNGHKKELEIQGVGFRAQAKGNTLVLNLGFSHPVEFNVPKELKLAVPQPTSIVLEGADKITVGTTASKIRDLKRPEPYKGKGIRYVGEYVRRKQGKSVTK